jgi:hypothetical protein
MEKGDMKGKEKNRSLRLNTERWVSWHSYDEYREREGERNRTTEKMRESAKLP